MKITVCLCKYDDKCKNKSGNFGRYADVQCRLVSEGVHG